MESGSSADSAESDALPVFDARSEIDSVKARLTRLEMALANLQQDLDDHVATRETP